MDLPAYAMFGASAADLITTEIALSQSGFVEVNPLFRNRAPRVAAKVLAPVALYGLSRELEKRGHRKWSKGLRWGAVAVWSAAAAWNINQLRTNR